MVGVVATLGISLAFGFGAGLFRQAEFQLARDGAQGREAASVALGDAVHPLRDSEVISTAYGPLVVTSFVGQPGDSLPIPGIEVVGTEDIAMVSPALARQLVDDWSGELRAWIGQRGIVELNVDALAFPDELVLVQFFGAVPSGGERRFTPVLDAGDPVPVDGSFVFFGLAVLLLPSFALAVGGIRLHLSNRRERYGLLRVLGMTPRRLRLLIAVEMGLPLVAGAAVGSLIYAAAMSILTSFRIAGASYWASDLTLPSTTALVIMGVVGSLGLIASLRIAKAASADPLGTLIARGKPNRRWLTLGLPLGVGLVVVAGQVDRDVSAWLVTFGLLASVFGLIGLTRLGVSGLGGILLNHSRMPIAGSRTSRSPADAIVGATASAVAIMLVAFILGGNFTQRPAVAGNFDVVAKLPDVADATKLVDDLEALDGIETVAAVARMVVTLNGEEAGSLYVASCAAIRDIVQLSDSCAGNTLYLGPRSDIATDRPAVVRDTRPFGTGEIDGSYNIGGTVEALWMRTHDVLLVVPGATSPTPHHTTILVKTDGTSPSLRAVLLELGEDARVESATTRQALEAGIDADDLIFEPYLTVMVASAAAIAAVALAFAVLILFRQRQQEFAIVRSLGATRTRLSADLGVLFLAPLLIALVVAIAAGVTLATVYNTAFGVPGRDLSRLVPLVGVATVAGALVSLWVMVRASRIAPAPPDPDTIVQ